MTTEPKHEVQKGPQYDRCLLCGRRYWSYTGYCPACSAPDPDPWGLGSLGQDGQAAGKDRQ